MPSFQNPRILTAKPRSRSWSSREYVSPDGQWTASFTDPQEWHMGADGWKLTLKRNGVDVSLDHPDLFKGVSGKGFRVPTELAPWSYDSRALAVITWEKTPVSFYDVLAKKACYCTISGLPLSSQWDPVGDNNLLLFEDHAVIAKSSGRIAAETSWTSQKYEYPRGFWLPHGNFFFVITRNPCSSRTEANFFTALGKLIETVPLDPATLVPFDEKAFACIDRKAYTLVINNTMKGVGFMLDSWHDSHYDQGVLQLATYRPVAMPYKSQGMTVCDVEEIWIALDVCAE